jgi:hypothetical protein
MLTAVHGGATWFDETDDVCPGCGSD